MRKHRPFVKRDIIETEILTGRKFSLVVFKIHRSIFSPLWQGQQRSRDDHFLVTYVHVDTKIYLEGNEEERWLYSSDAMIRDVFSLFCSLSFIFWARERLIEQEPRSMRARNALVSFLEKETLSISSRFSSRFLNSTIVIRIIYRHSYTRPACCLFCWSSSFHRQLRWSLGNA